MEFYMKNETGGLVPATIEQVIDPKELDGKLVTVKLGDASCPATEKDEEEFVAALELCEVLMGMTNTSIVVGRHSVQFETKEKCDE